MQMLLLYACSKSYCDNNEGKECAAKKRYTTRNETKHKHFNCLLFFLGAQIKHALMKIADSNQTR